MHIRSIRTILFGLFLALVVLSMSTASSAQIAVGVAVGFAPPLPGL